MHFPAECWATKAVSTLLSTAGDRDQSLHDLPLGALGFLPGHRRKKKKKKSIQLLASFVNSSQDLKVL